MKYIFILFLTMLTAKMSAADNLIDKFIARGFPRDYAVKLAVLQKKHPTWHFDILHITKLQPKYTWQYVLHQETDASPSRSLVSQNPLFSAYFHHADTKIYDASCRRASKAAVAYFLDPRNFLNERDIFQFENLNVPDDHIPIEAVKNALQGSFMANAVLENGKTYIEYFYELGKEFDINPVILSSRAKQEQGLQGTPLVSGKCGSMIAAHYADKNPAGNNIILTHLGKKYTKNDLTAFDGLYNFFNINASGNKRFLIYLNGMLEARTGTPHMASVWGSPQWNKKWKSLYGGAYKIAAKYIKNHQNTLYLQKWNVDPRSLADNGDSRNFWGQYMQNIGAAFSESANAYKAIKKQNLLELPFIFLIPVYSGMPQLPSPDPALGKCAYYRAYDVKIPPKPAVAAPKAAPRNINQKSAAPIKNTTVKKISPKTTTSKNVRTDVMETAIQPKTSAVSQKKTNPANAKINQSMPKKKPENNIKSSSGAKIQK